MPYLLDTHIAVWWLTDAKRLSRNHRRLLEGIEAREQRVFVSAITLLEIALIFGAGNRRYPTQAAEILRYVDTNPSFVALPCDAAVCTEVAVMGDSLRDPFDRTIVATARVHRLTLVTADERILDSRLVPMAD